MWNSSSTLLLCLDCQRPDVPLLHFRSALTAKDLKFSFRYVFTAKDLKFHVRTFVLHWLPKMWSSACALPLCLDCQICEVLPWLQRSEDAFRTCSAKTSKDVVPLPHFIFAWTFKDLQFRSCTFALSWLPKIWISASPLTLCLHCQMWEVPPPHFPSALTAKDL